MGLEWVMKMMILDEPPESALLAFEYPQLLLRALSPQIEDARMTDRPLAAESVP